MDDIITKHESFADIWKKLWDDMLQQMITNVTKMIFEGGKLGDIFGGSSSSSGGSSSGGGGLTGILSKFFGGGSGSSSNSGNAVMAPVWQPLSDSQLGGTYQPQEVNLSQDSISSITGSNTGVSSSSITAMNNTSSPDDAANVVGGGAAPLGGYSNTADYTGGSVSNQASLGSKLGGGIGGLAMALQGFQTGGLSGGLETGLGVYSAIQSIAPEAGPVGIGIAAAAGLVSLFSHKDDPAKMPDKYDTATYGQFVANAQGAGLNGEASVTANGQQFTSTDGSETGGTGDLKYISNYLKTAGNTAATTAGLSSSEISEFTGAQGITGGKDGNLSLNNGQTLNWQQLSTDMADAMEKVTTAMGKAGTALQAPVYAITRMAPDFNTARISSWGTSTAGVGTKATAPAIKAAPHVTVHVNNPVILGTTKEAVAKTISDTIAKNAKNNYRNTAQHQY